MLQKHLENKDVVPTKWNCLKIPSNVLS